VAEGAPVRFRLPILLGCLLMVVAGFLPWWRVGGETVSGVQVPASSGIGLEGPGLIIFFAAIVALVFLDIGYIRGRWGFVPLPQRSPGLAAAAVGIGLVLYGAGRGFGARRAV